MLTSPTLWVLSIMYFCSNAGWSVFITYDTKYLETNLHLSGWQLHVMSGMPLFFGGFGCLLGGLLTDRQVRYWGRRWGRTAQGFVAYGLGAAFFVLAICVHRRAPRCWPSPACAWRRSSRTSPWGRAGRRRSTSATGTRAPWPAS